MRRHRRLRAVQMSVMNLIVIILRVGDTKQSRFLHRPPQDLFIIVTLQ